MDEYNRKDKVVKGEHIIRAWKDEAYRLSLTEAERAQLPVNPAGFIEMDETALDGAAGAMPPACSYRPWCILPTFCHQCW